VFQTRDKLELKEFTNRLKVEGGAKKTFVEIHISNGAVDDVKVHEVADRDFAKVQPELPLGKMIALRFFDSGPNPNYSSWYNPNGGTYPDEPDHGFYILTVGKAE